MYEQSNYEGDGNNNRRKPSLVSVIVLGVLTAIVVGNLFFSFGDRTPMMPVSELLEGGKNDQTPSGQQLRSSGENSAESSTRPRGPLDVSDVVEAAMPSVVAITSETVQVIESYFYGRQEISNSSAGSGILIGQTDDEYLIATNYHVVKEADTLTICFSVEEEYAADALVSASLKGVDAVRDLALLAVNTKDVPRKIRSMIAVANLGDSKTLRVGDRVIAIGNALGYGQSVTQGCVSALERSLTAGRVTQTYLQTDAAINNGNSGGALLNAAGEVIGINAAKSAVSGSEGMGYAIPMDEAKPILDKMAEKATRERVAESQMGSLGVEARNVTTEAMEHYKIPIGAFVYAVSEGGPAKKAGIESGDVILSVEGNRVSDTDSLEDILHYFENGETVEVTYTSMGANYDGTLSVSLTLGKIQRTQETQEGYSGYSPFSMFDYWW